MKISFSPLVFRFSIHNIMKNICKQKEKVFTFG